MFSPYDTPPEMFINQVCPIFGLSPVCDLNATVKETVLAICFYRFAL